MITIIVIKINFIIIIAFIFQETESRFLCEYVNDRLVALSLRSYFQFFFSLFRHYLCNFQFCMLANGVIQRNGNTVVVVVFLKPFSIADR